MKKLRHFLYQVIFEAETLPGKVFDLGLILLIVLNILGVMLDSVKSIQREYGTLLNSLEWGFTIIFTVEYLLRIYCVKRPLKYVFSFFGLVDLFSILPSYIAFYYSGASSLALIRGIRILRIFRILKLAHYLGEARGLSEAIKGSWAKIVVFLGATFSILLIFGSLMYLVEGEESGFTSIPRSIYWAIVTMTTVGYGDIAPKTVLGQMISSGVMLMGYGIIAVPTGIVVNEFKKKNLSGTRTCKNCLCDEHREQAKFCHQCGFNLDAE